MNRTVISAVLCSTIMAAAAPAFAQQEQLSPELVAGAKTHFARGETFYQLGQFQKALGEFEAALKLIKRPSIVLNMAQCLRNLKRDDKALFFYKLYLSEYERLHPGWPPPYEDDVNKHIQALTRAVKTRAHAASVWVQGVKVAGAQVLVDGEPRVLTPMTRPLRVKQGKHLVEVVAAGFRPWRQHVEVNPGKALVIKARLVPLPGRNKLWLAGMIAGATLAAGAEALALVYTSRANEHFRDTAAYYHDRDLALGGHVAAGVLGALTVTSLVLYLMSGDDQAGTGATRAGLLPLTGGVAGSLQVVF